MVGELEKERVLFPNRKKTIFKSKLLMRLFVLWYNFTRPHKPPKKTTSNNNNFNAYPK